MKLLIKKDQRTTGMMTKTIVFQLTARVDLNAEERAALDKYKFGSEIVYSKENISPTYSDRNSWGGIARNLAAAAANLNLSVNALVQGTTVECKSISEVLDVEQTIQQGCVALKAMLDACRSFEGEIVREF